MLSKLLPWLPWIGAVGSGVLLALCYAPWEVGGLIWIWQSPLLAALWFSDPVKKEKNGQMEKRFCFGVCVRILLLFV